MANVDVSELTLDPDFVDPCVLIHRTTTVNSFGENILTESNFKTVGSVQPASGKTLQRLPEALRLADVSSFWIKAGIVVGAGVTYPDIISFRGRRYQVQTVQDWSNWGAGWAEGTCIAEKPAP